jgi:hypothetical protein
MQKSIREIVEETRQYYTEDPSRRGIGNGGDFERCLYIAPETGNKCAVGRCMRPEVLERIAGASKLDDLVSRKEHADYCGADASCIAKRYVNHTEYAQQDYVPLDTVLREEYRGHPMDFWLALQMWHDSAMVWGPGGLNEETSREFLDKALAFAPAEA